MKSGVIGTDGEDVMYKIDEFDGMVLWSCFERGNRDERFVLFVVSRLRF